MSEYASNTTFDAVAERLRSARRIMLTSHSKPDGDAIGSVLALYRGLEQIGKESEIVLRPPVAPNLQSLVGDTPMTLLEEAPASDRYDLIIVTDTGAPSQLEPLGPWLIERRGSVIVIDHHVNGDAMLATQRIVDPESASTTEMLVRLLDAVGVELTGGPFGVAEALLLGLATDTGWFKFNNADAGAFRVAARLVEAGADKSRIFMLVEENTRPEALALTARAVASVQYVAEARASVMLVTPEDFAATGGTVEDLTGVVNEPLRVGSVRVSALVSSVDGEVAKLSFRSKPPIRTKEGVIPSVDVNDLAHGFGGGGHVHAAGARVRADLETTRRQVIDALERAVAALGHA